MKHLGVAIILALSGCHSREDKGHFQLGLHSITPADSGVMTELFHRKPVLLTFDDGPEDAASDRMILATLRRHHAKALWLVTCRTLDPKIDQDAVENRVVLREIAAEGHLIGNHGYSHVDLRPLDREQLQHEIGDCSTLIKQVAGVTPIYFRPPWGRYTPKVAETVQANGLRMLLWGSNSFDSLFARFKMRPETFAPFMAANPVYDVAVNASSGDVLLFHDYPNTALALDRILTRLGNRGFQFVTPR